MSTLIQIKKQLEELLAANEISDWVPESDGFMSVGAETLRQMRRGDKHRDGWKYLGSDKGVDSKGREIRRHIIWRKSYLFSLFQQVA